MNWIIQEILGGVLFTLFIAGLFGLVVLLTELLEIIKNK